MQNPQIEDRPGGPAIVGTRITVDDVLVYLLDPLMTEDSIGRLLSLSIQEVAAARAYVLANPDTALARHLEIETRPEGINPPEVIERARRTHDSLVAFKTWLAARNAEEASDQAADEVHPGRRPSFREWIADQESNQVTTS